MKKIITPIKQPIKFYQFTQPIDSIAFFDIETTGLSANASSLYLIGLMYFNNSKKEWQLCQWFADNYHSEKEMLTDFLETLSSFRYLYHFNGKTFDIPYILKKCKRHAIVINDCVQNLLSDSTGEFSIDLLTIIRSLRHTLLLDKCNQTSVECWLGVSRTDIFSGKDLIPIYSEYMQQKILAPDNAAKLEQTLLLHNHDDIEMMLELCSILAYDEYLSENCSKRLLTTDNLQNMTFQITDDNQLRLSLPLPQAVPKEVFICKCYPNSLQAQLTLKETTALLVLPLCQSILKFFLSPYKDYYYLPKEDMAIHKSVAEFVDSTHRKKATAATCYIKKDGTFVPNLANTKKKLGDLPIFFENYKDSLSYYQLPKDYESNIAFWQEFLTMQFPMFR